MELSLAQIEADLVVAYLSIQRSQTEKKKMSKYIRGQAGFHLQQAAEKLIKYQMYRSGKKLDYVKVY